MAGAERWVARGTMTDPVGEGARTRAWRGARSCVVPRPGAVRVADPAGAGSAR